MESTAQMLRSGANAVEHSLTDSKQRSRYIRLTGSTAELVGKIGAESSALGMTIPFDDLLIGACALELGYGVATRNRRHFEKIHGLNLIAF